MCTVVVRWLPGSPLRVMAVRDELVGRSFDDPGRWWPDQPDVLGGRDHTAGGSWCVTDVSAGVSALVLNRPERRVAAENAPSRGELPLLAAAYGRQWPAHLDLSGMASFALLLATPDSLGLWTYDGSGLTATVLPPGTHMVTSGGAEDGKSDRYLPAFTGAQSSAEWRDLLIGHRPEDDAAALVVTHAMPHGTYATVFAQVFESSPGVLSLTYSRTPWLGSSWTGPSTG